MADGDDTGGKGSSMKKKDSIPHGMPQSGMGGIPGAGLMGASSQQPIMAGGASSGTQEWEWLTMSL